MQPENTVLVVFAILFGLAFGSFLNVCIVRLPQGASILSPRSHCVTCNHAIRSRDNIPLLSWILLRGHCRDCGAPISIRYPLVELVSASLFVLCLVRFGASLEAVGMATFCWLLLGLLLMDAETFLLPNAFTLPGIVLGFVYNAASANTAGAAGVLRGIEQAALGTVSVAGFLWAVRLLYRALRRREGMGFGDVKLGAMLGAWLGWQMGAVSLFVAIVTAAVAGVVISMRHRRMANNAMADVGSMRVPFGSFLAAAGIITVFAGVPLLRWYLGFFPR